MPLGNKQLPESILNTVHGVTESQWVITQKPEQSDRHFADDVLKSISLH